MKNLKRFIAKCAAVMLLATLVMPAFLGQFYFEVRAETEMSEPVTAPPEVVIATAVFTDTEGHWAETYIEKIRDLGIVSGKTADTFAPNDNITRGELTKIAIIALGFDLPENVLESFTDVDTSAWFAPYISAAKIVGIIGGYADGSFNPNGLINRAEALKILLEAAGFEDLEEHFENNYANMSEWTYVTFPDVGIYEWYAKYVAYAYDNGIISGYEDRTFGPGNSITRAEVAKVVSSILDMM